MKRDVMDDKVYEAIGMLLRGMLYHEHSGGRTPEHLAGQVRRTIAILSPVIAAEIEQDGAARVYEERWEAPEFAAAKAIAEDVRLGRTSQQIRDEIIAKVGMMVDARSPEMQARYDAAVARERGGIGPGAMFVIVAGSRSEDATTLARAILEMLQESGVRCSMPEEIENPYDGDSIEQLGTLHRSTGHRVIVQTTTATPAPELAAAAAVKFPKCAVLTCSNEADLRWYARDVNNQSVMICDGHEPLPQPSEVAVKTSSSRRENAEPDTREPDTRHWRNSGVAWFWSNAREDFGSVILQAGRYIATTVRGSAEFEVLGDAKDFVEEHSS